MCCKTMWIFEMPLKSHKVRQHWAHIPSCCPLGKLRRSSPETLQAPQSPPRSPLSPVIPDGPLDCGVCSLRVEELRVHGDELKISICGHLSVIPMWLTHGTSVPQLPLPSRGHRGGFLPSLAVGLYSEYANSYTQQPLRRKHQQQKLNQFCSQIYNLVSWFPLCWGEYKMLFRIIHLPLLVLPTTLPPSNRGWDVESGLRAGRARLMEGWNIPEHLGWVPTLLGTTWHVHQMSE